MIELGLDAAAAYRLTRLVTRDTITRPVRARIIRTAYEHRDRQALRGTPNIHAVPGGGKARSEAEWDQLPHDDDDTPKLAAFIVCPWCVSVYISFGVIAARRYAGGVWEPLAQVLALSAAAALIGGLEVE